jgi:hypothetical protein
MILYAYFTGHATPLVFAAAAWDGGLGLLFGYILMKSLG